MKKGRVVERIFPWPLWQKRLENLKPGRLQMVRTTRRRVQSVISVVYALVVSMLFSLPGCSLSTARNHDLTVEPSRASLELREPRGKEDVLLILALSGGGSRAAYFATAVMFRLQEAFPEIDLLKEVDVISAVSGGSLPAAYYCISKDPKESVSVEMPFAPRNGLPGPKFAYDPTRGQLTTYGPLAPAELEALRRSFPPEAQSRVERLAQLARANAAAERVWAAPQVKKLMKKNYLLRWVVYWFFPHNIVRYWLTSFTRTDIMAGIFEDDLFDTELTGRNLAFRDLNPERPYLILNATDATHAMESGGAFNVFTFTEQEFGERLRSNINDFSIGHAVMTSAAFPGVFNYVNLQDRRTAERRFAHLFDGGTADNLGLTSIATVAGRNWNRYQQLAVILVDSYVEAQGVPAETRDPRGLFGYIVDTNFLDTYDSLLKANRKNLLTWFEQQELRYRYEQKGRPELCHLTFEKIEDQSLQAALNRIPTNFSLSDKDASLLDRAAELLVSEETECLKKVRAMFLSPNTASAP
jgi:predicted acylesterase/phospholipase RssA